jgi:sulfur carrier protein ThiS
MSVTLILVGGLKEYAGGRERVEAAAGPTVAKILEDAGIKPALVAAVLQDDHMVSLDYRPQDKETLKLIAVIGGG